MPSYRHPAAASPEIVEAQRFLIVGTDESVPLTWSQKADENAAKVAVDITGVQFTASYREGSITAAPLFTLTSTPAAGITITDAAAGKFTYDISDAQIDMTTVDTIGYFDIFALFPSGFTKIYPIVFTYLAKPTATGSP